MQTQNLNDLTMGAAGGEPAGMRDLSRAPAEKIDRAAQTAHETVDRVSRRAVELTERATTEGERMYEATCNWVAAHPMQAVLGAFVAGYLYGRIRG
jgi:hypothetical protein